MADRDLGVKNAQAAAKDLGRTAWTLPVPCARGIGPESPMRTTRRSSLDLLEGIRIGQRARPPSVEATSLNMTRSLRFPAIAAMFDFRVIRSAWQQGAPDAQTAHGSGVVGALRS